VIVAAAGIVIGFLLMASPAHADIGGISATLKKATPHSVSVSKVRLGTVAMHPRRTVRHTATVTHVRPVIHKISRPFGHRVSASRVAWTHRVVRPAAHRAVLPRTAVHRIVPAKAHSHSATHRASKITTTHKITATAHKSHTSTTKITTAAGKLRTGTTKITAAAHQSAALIERGAGAIAHGPLTLVADTGAILSDAIQPVVQPVRTPVSRLHDRVLAVLPDKIAQAIPPVVDVGGLAGGNLLPPVGNQPGSGSGLQHATTQAPPSIVAAWTPHPSSGQRDDIAATPSIASGLIATLGDLAAGAREVLLGIPASSSGATATIALLAIAAGVAAAGSATSGGPASISLAFVEGGFSTSATGRSRRLADFLRQTGWRTPHRPSFSPD
jgi:hypothetical protein